MSWLLFLSLSSGLKLAYAHGFVTQVGIDGAVYQGNPPMHNETVSPIRMVSSNGPVQNMSDINLACGLDAQNAPIDVIAQPGSNITFDWVSGSGGLWPHGVGPILTYMASCGGAGATCIDFNASSGQWFKINEVAKESNGSTWVQANIMNGGNFTVTIPSDMASGAYLIRNEIISLQNAMSVGGAESYPSCTQLNILGNGTLVPSPNDTVTFPGAYASTDPGIHVDVYDDPNAPYVIPGPPVATLVPQSTVDSESQAQTQTQAQANTTSDSASPTQTGPGSDSATPTPTPMDNFNGDDQTMAVLIVPGAGSTNNRHTLVVDPHWL